jgi:glutaredoxin 3
VTVTVYSTAFCPFCTMAKRLLTGRGIEFAEVRVDDDFEKRKWLIEATGQRTVPQIFIGDESIGGFQELAALDRSGGLGEKLAAI